MRWATVRKAEITPAGNRIRIWFEGCGHMRENVLGDMVRRVAEEPGVLVGEKYPCRECSPGQEID